MIRLIRSRAAQSKSENISAGPARQKANGWKIFVIRARLRGSLSMLSASALAGTLAQAALPAPVNRYGAITNSLGLTGAVSTKLMRFLEFSDSHPKGSWTESGSASHVRDGSTLIPLTRSSVTRPVS